MKPFTFNTLLFFLVYVPLTLVIGLLIGAFRVDGAGDAAGYEFFLWLVIALQMIVPTLLLFTVIYFSVCFVGRHSTGVVKRSMSIGVIGLSLPLVQAFLWTGASFSFTWVMVAVIPALIFGGIVKFPTNVRAN